MSTSAPQHLLGKYPVTAAQQEMLKFSSRSWSDLEEEEREEWEMALSIP